MDAEELKISDLGQLEPGLDEAKKVGWPHSYIHMGFDAGTAKVGDFNFDLIAGAGGNMVIKCNETDRTFVLTWQDAIKIAIERGIIDMDMPVDPFEEDK